MLSDLRLRMFFRYKQPFSDWSRARRMRMFSDLMELKEYCSIIDLGGSPATWSSVQTPLEITILNLPGRTAKLPVSRQITKYIEGDACNVHLPDRSFDLVFSNSVIEHVGDKSKQVQFASEARRLGRSYWIQTPSKWFPIEAHCGMLFWWFYPAVLRRFFIHRWRKILPDWTEMVEGSAVLSKRDMRRLFPEAAILTERVLGISKSYIAVFKAPDSYVGASPLTR
jgi:Methyltransferase domain